MLWGTQTFLCISNGTTWNDHKVGTIRQHNKRTTGKFKNYLLYPCNRPIPLNYAKGPSCPQHWLRVPKNRSLGNSKWNEKKSKHVLTVPQNLPLTFYNSEFKHFLNHTGSVFYLTDHIYSLKFPLHPNFHKEWDKLVLSDE